MPFHINKTIIIGGFNIEAYASDEPSGLFSVSFYLGDKRIAEATKEPFTMYCGLKNNGPVTLKVIAEDFGMNVRKDSLDIVYYNFL